MKHNLKLSVAANACIKVLALIVSLVSTPIMMSFFSSDEVLGAWFTVLSVLNWISFFDFGIGNGLRNDLTYALNKSDSERARIVISSSVYFLGAVVVALIPLGVAVSAYVPWNSVLSVGNSEICRGDLTVCMAIVIAGTLLQLVLKLVNSLFYAVQRNAAPALLLFISNCLILVAIAFPPPLAGAGERFMYMCIVEMIALSVPLVVAGFVIFATELKGYTPRLKDVRTDYFNSLLFRLLCSSCHRPTSSLSVRSAVLVALFLTLWLIGFSISFLSFSELWLSPSGLTWRVPLRRATREDSFLCIKNI